MTDHANENAVIVVGAGIAGLALTRELVRRDVEVVALERYPSLPDAGLAINLPGNAIAALRKLGIDDVRRHGVPVERREYRSSSGRLLFKVDEARFWGDDNKPQCMRRSDLASMLTKGIPEGVIRQQCAVASVSTSGRSVAVDTIDDGKLTGKYLVGADGGRSFVRQSLGIGFPGKTLGVRAIVADVTLTGLGREVWHRFGEGDMQRQISACPLAGTDMFQLQGPIPLEGQIDLSAEGLTALVAERTRRSDIEIQSVSWASAFNMNARLADVYRVGAIFLVGDAAHTHPPTGGQGLNTSVQDAYNLGWKLASVIEGADDYLLEGYEAERRPVAEAMLGLSTGLLDAMKRGDMRRGRSVHQLDIGYPESALSIEMPPRLGRLLAGDRAPDAPLLGAAGKSRRLFDLLAGPHSTLITYGWQQASRPKSRRGLTVHHIGPGGDLIDNGGHFKRAYDIADGGTVIIRPDGYVGAVFGSDAFGEVETYLARLGLALEA